jgi:hypothetical protein
MLKALLLLASVFFFPNVTSFSANFCASFAFGYVVDIDSCRKSDVTRFRSSACLWEDVRPKWRYFMRPPAIMERVQEKLMNRIVNTNDVQLLLYSAGIPVVEFNSFLCIGVEQD